MLTGGVIPSVAVTKTVSSPLTHLAWAALPFETYVDGQSNTTTMWSSGAPTRLVAPVDGIYLASGSLGFIVSSASGQRYMAMRKNGTGPLRRLESGAVPASGEVEFSGTLTYKLAAGDYVELMYYTAFSSDFSRPVQNPPENNPGFSLTYLGGI